MAKGEKCVFGVKEPTSVNQLNGEYMMNFLRAKLADGSIKKEQIEEYKKRKNEKIAREKNITPIKKSRIERNVFADMFMPKIAVKASKKIDFDKELDAIING